MNFNDLDKQYTPDEAEFVHLEDFEGEKEYDNSGNPVGFYAMGSESDVARRFMEKRLNQARKQYKKSKKDKEFSIDEAVEDEAKRLGEIVTGWSGFWLDEDKGKELEFNRENLLMVLQHPKLNRYRVQLENFTSDPLNYTKK